ncbi:MAG: hypothetical protein O2826_02210 [Chloroflexi bacterium]|nr:hypothetical protein [Chloroflexota bacterium]MDA1173313.1 hypothetical protein [Chloroflexota bacterium]
MSRDSWSRDSWDVDPNISGMHRDSDGNDTLVSMTKRVANLQRQLDAVGELARNPWAAQSDNDDSSTLVA